MDSAPTILRHDAAAAYLGIHHTTFRRWRKTGALDAVTHRTPAGDPYWLPEELNAWLRSRCSAPEAGQ